MGTPMTSAIDVESILQEISADSPCGEDLEYDPEFIELERLAAGRAEQQIGDTLVEAEEPDWKAVQKASVELLSRTKDIRVLTYLIRAALHTEGYSGVAKGINLLHGLVEQNWEQIHPQLDAEDDNDPTMRINAISTLADSAAMLTPLGKAPLVTSKMLGQFSLRDYAIANGELEPLNETDAVSMAQINAAFMDADLEELQATFDAVTESIDHLTELEDFITELVGTANAISLSDLVHSFKEAKQVLNEQLQARGVGSAEETESSNEEGAATPASGAAPALSGSINSRADVIRALDKIIDYYNQNEPSSPIPILMKRAKKLVSLDFLEIIKNMAPDAMDQVDLIRGPDEEEE
ncbi:type VI secretion system protein TssA [bacterium endosymbiont of Escarpia laminata]|nr:MAG: type VI secretion system protein TssA [bacterium endosymbiont of Escarpia laminata]RLJ22288.1 MAG: type VI secretion system protein TssA [bacterium endosymbiont of Escarpia laminata]